MASTIQRDLLAATVQTTGNTPTVLISIPIPLGATVLMNASVAAHRAATEGLGIVVQGTYRNNGGVVSLIGANVNAISNRDGPLASTGVSFVISGSNVNVTVTGVAAFTIEWGAFITMLISI